MRKTRVRVLYFSTWVEGLADATGYLESLSGRDLRGKISDPGDTELLGMARLDCDWDGECLRAFAAMQHPQLEFAPAKVADARGILEYLSQPDPDVEPWLVFIDQRPASIAPVVGRILQAFTDGGGRVLYWAYDDASRSMECFADGVAPHVSVLLHDESPLADNVRRALPSSCTVRHLSWVANIVPYRYAMREAVEERIVFLGSRLGVTEHRMEQVRALEAHFGNRFTCITDHSVAVADRGRFAGIKVHLCPEGRKFGVETMSRSHTDRPFWAGCMGQVPVSENSKWGGRLDELADAGRILRYSHGDVEEMIGCCERALTVDLDSRREIYEYFNTHGVVGPIAAGEIAAVSGRR